MKKQICRSFVCKVASLFLIAAIFAGCSQQTSETNNPEDTAGITTQITEAQETEAKPWYEEHDYDGSEIVIFSQHTEWEKENDGDVVNDALYERSLWLEENLGIKITPFPIDELQVISTITNTVQSGEDAWDIINASQYRVAPLMVKGMFTEMSEAEHLDFDAECWAQGYMANMSVNGKIFFMTGDISLKFLHRTSCMYFNIGEYLNLTGNDKSELYKIVKNGEWTFDKFEEYLSQSYRDLNGNSEIDDDDYFGTAVMTGSITEHLAMNAGVKYTSMENGIPVINTEHSHTVNVIDAIYSLFFENPAVVTYPASLESLDVTMVNKLAADELVFMFGWFDTASLMREMETDYGVIPYPMFDEAQDGYRALAHDNAGQFGVPATVPTEDIAMISAVLQAAAEYSAENLTPAYYEIALKTKYIRDSESVEILDIIRENAATDFAYVYNYALNELGTITRTLMKSASRDFTSLFDSNRSTYQAKLDEIIEACLATQQ